MLKNIFSKPWITVYGPEDETEEVKILTQVLGIEGLSPEIKSALEEKLLPSLKTKKLTQDQVNDLIVKERKKSKSEIDKAIADLENYKKIGQHSAKEKEELQQRIEALQNSMLTTEEKATREKERLQNDHKAALENERKAGEMWQGLYSDEAITNQILMAKDKYKAASSEQMIAFLKPNTKIVPQTDAQGNVIQGKYIPKVKFKEKTKEGQELELELTIDETVKKMKESPDRFGNLFISDAKGGIGSGRIDALGNIVDPNKPPVTTNHAEYVEWRKKAMKTA